MATKEVSFNLQRASWGGIEDTWRGSSALGNDNYAQANLVLGDNAKGEGLSHGYHRYLVSGIPTDVTINRAKLTLRSAWTNDGVWEYANLPVHQLGMLAWDGKWEVASGYTAAHVGEVSGFEAAGVKGVQDEWHFISQVYDTGSGLEFTTSLVNQGIWGQLASKAIDWRTAEGEYGMKFEVVSGTFTLGSIKARIWRQDRGGRPTTNLRMHVYSADENHLPDTLLAVSEDFPWDSCQTSDPGDNPADWAVDFQFSGGNQITMTQGSGYVYIMRVHPRNNGLPFLYWAFDLNSNDDDQDGVFEKDNSLPVSGVYGICNQRAWGWHVNLYPRYDQMNTALWAGTSFTPAKKSYPTDMPHEIDVEWGDAAYSPDVVHPLKPWLDILVQDPSYTLSGGIMFGLYIYTPNATGSTVHFLQNRPVDLSRPLLTVEYTEPEPGQATNPNPADLASGVALDTDLSWTAGSGALLHAVYFGTNPSPGSGEYMGTQSGVTFNPSGDLDPTTTYYWRIDEVGKYETTSGEVWEFTTLTPVPPAPTCDWYDPASGEDWHTPGQLTDWSSASAGATWQGGALPSAWVLPVSGESWQGGALPVGWVASQAVGPGWYDPAGSVQWLVPIQDGWRSAAVGAGWAVAQVSGEWYGLCCGGD